jgi:DNA-binding Xre family transcriptional regulator
MDVQILTTDDLDKFRVKLLGDIENLLNTKQPKKWLKTHEVVELLGISEVTLQTLRNRKKIPFTKLGGICFYNAEEIDDYLSKSTSTIR